MSKEGLSQSGLGYKANITQSGISRILNGKERMSVDRAQRIAVALGYTMSELFSAEFSVS